MYTEYILCLRKALKGGTDIKQWLNINMNGEKANVEVQKACILCQK